MERSWGVGNRNWLKEEFIGVKHFFGVVATTILEFWFSLIGAVDGKNFVLNGVLSLTTPIILIPLDFQAFSGLKEKKTHE